MAASMQDRDGAKTTLLAMHLFTPVRFVYGMVRRLAHGKPATRQQAWTLDDLKG